MSSLLVIFVRMVEQFCRFWIWSETECKTPAEYGPQYISTPYSHTLAVYTVHLVWEGGEGVGEVREMTEGHQFTKGVETWTKEL